MPLSGALRAHAKTRGESAALRWGTKSVGYAALLGRLCARYAALGALPRRARAVAPHQPLVALLLGNHPQMPEWLALGLSAPVTLALLDPAWPEALQHEMLAALAPDLVITAENAAFGLDAAPLPLPATTPEAPLFIGFTSGTTARPKAFLRNRVSWGLTLAQSAEVFGLDAASHTLAPGPLIHGLTFYALAETLHAGASFTGMARFSAAEAFDHLAAGEITRLVAVPTMLAGLARESETRGQPLPTRQITTAGAKLPAPLLARLPNVFPQAQVTEYYGASELGFVSLAHHRREASGALMSTARGVGQAYPGVTLEIRQGDTPVSRGEIGTVHVKSPHPIEGYLLAEGTHAFTRTGAWASVGDLGALDEAGNLTLLGRADGMVITGGYNVYPEEIAALLASAPGVGEAEVYGLPDAYLGQRLVAVVRASGPAPDLAEFCAARLPRYKVPRAFFMLAQWPLTPSGKIARAVVKDWIETGDARLVPLA